MIMKFLCRENRADWLVWSTIFFLGISQVIYAVSWLRWYVAIAYVAFLLVSFATTFRNETIDSRDTATVWLRWPLVMAIAAIIFIWNYFSGVGYFSYQNSDWIKHNAIMFDLINKPWPVFYSIMNDGDNQSLTLVYYLAYYLPIALIGKLFSAKFAVTYFALIYNIFATSLSVLWLFRLVGRASVLILLSFVFFSGLGIVHYWVNNVNPLWTDCIEWWVGKRLLQFSSNSTALYWVPQQVFGAWLGTSLLLHQFMSKDGTENTLFYWSLSLFWSPFIFIGQIFLVGADLLYKKFRGIVSMQNILGAGATVIILGFFYTSRIDKNSPTFLNISDLIYYWDRIATFIELQLLIFIPFILWVFRKGIDKRYRYLFLVLLLNLVCAMTFRLGLNNDFCMRESLPGLFILQVLLFKNFSHPFEMSKQVVPKILLIVVLIIGAQTSFREIYRGIVGERATIDINANLIKDLDARWHQQYLGSIWSFYDNNLLRR